MLVSWALTNPLTFLSVLVVLFTRMRKESSARKMSRFAGNIKVSFIGWRVVLTVLLCRRPSAVDLGSGPTGARVWRKIEVTALLHCLH